jgi:hypothetical protein
MDSPEPNEKKLKGLATALRKADDNQQTFVPSAIDDAILRQARDHFATAQPTKNRWDFAGLPSFWRMILGGAAIAVLPLAIFLLQTSQKTPAPQFAREDINRDGQVDILDAMALAKLAQANPGRKITETDIRAVALAAVRLNSSPGI